MKFTLVLVLLLTFNTVNTYARVLHLHRNSYQVSTGVHYDQIMRLTNSGLVDVHVITVDLTNPYLTLGPVLPEAHGSRGTTTSLLNDGGAIAGINADFFNMSLYPSTALGQVIQNGNSLAINRGEDGYATFFMDTYNNPFIEYIRPTIIFRNNGIQNLTIQSINNIQGAISATVFDQNAIFTSAGIDARQENLIKLVIEDDIITYISAPGELVEVPYNGYIIALSYSYAYYFIDVSIFVGDSAELYIQSQVDMESIWQAIGGAGTILQNGEISTTGFVVAPNARHPRSAVGINYDGSKVFLVAVDGRNRSIGATHAEMADILISIGAYRAMHLDGGGSTTMGVRHPGSYNITTTNTPSDGSQRRVVNALGVFNSAPVGIMTEASIRTFPSSVFVGDVLNVYTVGLDAHLNTMYLDQSQVQLNAFPHGILREGNSFFPETHGTIELGLVYGGFQDFITVDVHELAQIVPNITSLELNSGETSNLTFFGLSPLGHRGNFNRISVDVMPSEAGTFVNGVFTAGTQSGVVRASVGHVTTYVGVNVNDTGHIVHPPSTTARNPYRAFLNEMAPGFDITLVGSTTLNDFIELDELSEYVQIRNNALENFIQYSDLGVFVGPTEVEGVGGLQTINWTNNYSFNRINDTTAIVSLNATQGSLTATSVYNWSFINEVNYFDLNHLIILLNRPVHMLPEHEQQIFTSAVENIATEKDVFVVSSFGTYTTSSIENGVNYINLGALFSGDDVNNDFQILRLRISYDTIRFDLESVF